MMTCICFTPWEQSTILHCFFFSSKSHGTVSQSCSKIYNKWSHCFTTNQTKSIIINAKNNRDGTYEIVYDDGDQESNVSEDHVKSLNDMKNEVLVSH